MKIPTILGITLLIILIFAALAGFFYWQKNLQTEKQSFLPKNVELVNITANTFGVIWETDRPVIGTIQYSDKLFNLSLITLTSKASDVRSLLNNNPRQTHFVMIKKLNADTNYFYKILNNQFSFPDKFLTFMTPKNLNTSKSLNPPIRGTVIDQNGNSIEGAIVKLKIINSSPLVNYTGQTGNFIITTEGLRTSDLSKPKEITGGELALITVYYQTLKSEVIIKTTTIPQILPPIIIGQNIDFTNIEASVSAKPVFSSKKINFDLNNDGVINSLDRAIIIQNLGNNPKNSEADLNGDGVVDNTDLDLIRKAVQK